MRKAVFLTFITIFLISGIAAAQVRVGVYDKETGQPLPGATLELAGGSEITATNADGLAVIEHALPFALNISFVGYEPAQVDIASEQINIFLKPREKLLDEVVITGFEDHRKLLETPGAIHRLKPEAIERSDETSLLRGINTIPGVRMEQRSPGSYRISIRGSSLRAPFDVRNVKIYWNGIPFTDPNGITPLNLLDINQMREVEVVKGPAASAYGAGTGGVVNLSSETADFGERSVSGAITVGSHQLRRYSASYESGSLNSNLRAVVSRQESGGYRQHSAFERTTAQLFGKLFPTRRHTLTANIFYSDLFYETPGGLTNEQFRQDPQQARPGVADQLASVDYNAFLASLTSDYQWTPEISSVVSLYSLQSFFAMPFLFDFERETRLGLGGRAVVNYKYPAGKIPFNITAGGEYQYMFLQGRNYGNNGGDPDSLRFDDEVKSMQNMVFLKIDAEAPGEFFITAGLSYNYLNYNIFRLTGPTEEGSADIDKVFDPVWTPRVGLVKKIGPSLSVQGSVSRGFSPPTVKEIRTGDGVLNIELRPEEGTNYEIGVRGSVFNGRFTFDVSAFTFQLKETIVSYTDSVINTVKFRNAGSTSQPGVEVSAAYRLIDNADRFVQHTNLGLSYTRHRFRFRDYVQEGRDFSGNMLTGVSPHGLTASLDAILQAGFYGHILYNYSDAMPLNDANTVFSAPYHVVDLKLGWEGRIGMANVDAFIGANNLFNVSYSLGNDLNAFGERYYQPAAGQTVYFGIKFKYIYGSLN